MKVPKLLVIFSLFGALIVPYVALSAVSQAWSQAIWLPINLGLALGVTWIAFAFIPIPADMPQRKPAQLEPKDSNRRALRMALGLIPFTLFFLFLDGDHLLTLVCFGMFSQQLAMSNEGESVTPLEKLGANLVGAIVAMVAYEIVVIAPILPVMALMTLIMSLACGWWMVSGRHDASLASSAMTGAVILFADSMEHLSDTVAVSSAERLLEIAAAVLFATIVFYVLDNILPDRRAPIPSA